MTKICVQCQDVFEPTHKEPEKQKICVLCIMHALDLYDIEAMTDDEVEAELEEAGFDQVKMNQHLQELLAKIKGDLQ